MDLGANIGTTPVLRRGVEAEIRVLFANLIDNALNYTPPGGKIDVSLDRRGAWLSVDILDTRHGPAKGRGIAHL